MSWVDDNWIYSSKLRTVPCQLIILPCLQNVALFVFLSYFVIYIFNNKRYDCVFICWYFFNESKCFFTCLTQQSWPQGDIEQYLYWVVFHQYWETVGIKAIAISTWFLFRLDLLKEQNAFSSQSFILISQVNVKTYSDDWELHLLITIFATIRYLYIRNLYLEHFLVIYYKLHWKEENAFPHSYCGLLSWYQSCKRRHSAHWA